MADVFISLVNQPIAELDLSPRQLSLIPQLELEPSEPDDVPQILYLGSFFLEFTVNIDEAGFVELEFLVPDDLLIIEAGINYLDLGQVLLVLLFLLRIHIVDD